MLSAPAQLGTFAHNCPLDTPLNIQVDKGTITSEGQQLWFTIQKLFDAETSEVNCIINVTDMHRKSHFNH
jgi:hypothetical protein